MALFKLTYEELRERFILKRFAETQNFGRPDIEAWLARQRAGEPVDMSEWDRLFAASAGLRSSAQGRELELLEQCARKLHSPPTAWVGEQPRVIEYRERIQPLLATLAPLCSIYYGRRFCDVVVVHASTSGPQNWSGTLIGCDLVKPDGKGTIIAPLLSEYAMDAILATWLRGCEGATGGGRCSCDPDGVCRAKTAGEFICASLAAEIARVRQEAGNDFDHAVAVSEDGERIVDAEVVIVLDEIGRMKARGGHVFRRDKILRAPSQLRKMRAHYLGACIPKPPIPDFQTLVCMDVGHKVFITPARYAPEGAE